MLTGTDCTDCLKRKCFFHRITSCISVISFLAKFTSSPVLLLLPGSYGLKSVTFIKSETSLGLLP